MIRGHFGGFKRPRNDSGVMFADGIHFVDLFNFILNALPKSVLAIHHDFMGRGMDDMSFVSLEYETPHGKIWATVENEYFIPGKFREVIVCGDKMSAVCDYNVAQYKIKTLREPARARRQRFQGRGRHGESGGSAAGRTVAGGVAGVRGFDPNAQSAAC